MLPPLMGAWPYPSVHGRSNIYGGRVTVNESMEELLKWYNGCRIWTKTDTMHGGLDYDGDGVDLAEVQYITGKHIYSSYHGIYTCSYL